MLLSIIMPGRNLDKVFLANSYYHIYNRGVNRRTIFIDDDDYRVFMNLIKRYTGKTVQKDKRGREYPNYSSDIGILAYCLMPNHFHLLIETKENADKLTALMTSLMTAYVLYFNKKYQRVGALFGKEYRAVLIDTDAQFWHISRYIHLNPMDILDDYKRYRYSSINYYLTSHRTDWLNPEVILGMFRSNGENYELFLDDYVARWKELKLTEESELY